MHEKASEKLRKLNVGDKDFIDATVEQVYTRDESEKKICTFPSKKIWKKIVLATSTSGAIDSHGLSLRLTKALITNSKPARDFLYTLMKAMAMVGYVPEGWKVDLISHLYKKKGDRMDAKNWRPITIAASFGKHFDKVSLWQLRSIHDLNHDNHAYIKDCSCLTAILVVMEYFRCLKRMGKEARKQGYIIIPVFMAEDISSAFESIDQDMVDRILELCFSAQGNFDLRGVIKSYLDRVSWIVDRRTKDKVKLDKTYDFKTSPQGSTLSPALWRLFDNIFSTMYKDKLNELMEVVPMVVDYKHVAYADDHVTILAIKVKAGTNPETITYNLGLIIDTCRSLLDQATTAGGCGINLSKSEVLVPPQYADADKFVKPELTWLGFTFAIGEDGQIKLTDTKMLARFKRTEIMARSVFQYIRSRVVRRRIYQVYVAPVIEWYLPVIMLKPKTAGSKLNAIESFQHKMMCLISGACSKVSAVELGKQMAEMPVHMKLGRLACRLVRNITRDEKLLRGINNDTVDTRVLRSGKKRVQGWPGVDKKDFGDQLYIKAKEYEQDEGKRLYTKGDEKELLFDSVELEKWVKAQNNRIKEIIELRRQGSELIDFPY